MRKKIMLSAFILILIGLTATYLTKAQSMYTINIDIGKNIAKTAKESGAPRFGIESHWGLMFYEIVDMPLDIPVHYARPGYEITAQPLFSLTMSADTENNNDMAVEQISLQFSRHAAKTHDEARAFIGKLLNQFTKGGWRRHISSDCPAIAGRSTYLDENGKIDAICPLDPTYLPPMQDWLQLMRMANYYEWIGEGVLARLTISFNEDSRGLTYNMELEFEDFAIANRRNKARQAKALAEGDKKGWNSTERHKQDMQKNKEKILKLETNAVRRGDHLVSRK